MRSFKTFLASLPVVLITLACVSKASAIPTAILSNSGSDTGFDGLISATDLINSGQPTFSSAFSYRNPSFGFAGINNGAGGTNVTNSTFYTNVQTPTSVNFEMNLGPSANGYTIQSINTFAGWAGVNITQANQKYEVLVSKVGDATFRSLGTFTNAPFTTSSTAASSTQINITDTTGALATNVDRVRFNLIYPGFVGNNSAPGTVYRELDVAGIATAVAAAPQVNLIQNGSFESSVLGAGANQIVTTGSPLVTNWTINGEATLVRGSFSTVASDGAQWLSLESNGTGFPNNKATVSQVIATQAGTTYSLVFDYSTLGNDSVSTPWQMSYDVGTGPNNLLIGNSASLTLAGWLHEEFTFVASSSATTISFSGISKVNGFFGPAIDNVGVFAFAIPEPATAALALVSLGGLMLRRRRMV